VRRFILIVGLFFFVFELGLRIPTIQAQPYPAHPIQLVIVAGPGDASDITARLLAEELTKILNMPVIPLNKPGAASTLATDFVVKSRKDGYTLLYGNTSGTVYAKASNPDNVPYDPVKDLEPLGLHVFFPNALSLRPDAPWKTFSEFIEYARKNPWKLRCGTMGVGSICHFQLEIIKALAGVDITMIPFKGAMPAVTALLGGHIDSAFVALTLVRSHYESGKLRGILLDEKVPDVPDVPTLQQLGYNRDLPSAWFALFAPAGVPEDVKKVLVPAIEKGIKNSELGAKIQKLGFVVDYKSPAELKKLIIKDYEEARSIATKLDLK
jgi:tripartite-type tricarboxylate transporter receptor subunit TctC